MGQTLLLQFKDEACFFHKLGLWLGFLPPPLRGLGGDFHASAALRLEMGSAPSARWLQRNGTKKIIFIIKKSTLTSVYQNDTLIP